MAPKVGPRPPKDAKKEPKSSLLGAPGDTFRRKNARLLYSRKTYYLLCFNHIKKVRAPPFSSPKAPRKRTRRRERSFRPFWAAWDATRWPEARQRRQKGPQNHPRGLQKAFKNRPWNPPGRPGRPGRLQRYPPGRKMTENDTEMTEKHTF